MKSRSPFGGDRQTNKETRIVISKQYPQFLGLCKNKCSFWDMVKTGLWSTTRYAVLCVFSLLFLRKMAEKNTFYHKFRSIHQQKNIFKKKHICINYWIKPIHEKFYLKKMNLCCSVIFNTFNTFNVQWCFTAILGKAWSYFYWRQLCKLFNHKKETMRSWLQKKNN